MLTLSSAEIAARHPGKVLLPAKHCPPLLLPLFGRVRAGFPSPADDYIEGLLDLNEYLVHDRPGTIMARIENESMIEAGIFPGDVLIVDRGLPPQDGHIVMAEVNGEFIVRELRREYGRIALMPRNRRFRSVLLRDEDELTVFGVVTAAIHQFVGTRR